MTIARSQIVDLQSTRWYHCISRCVRKSFLLTDEFHDRKSWIDNRLKQLEAIFAISVGGFSTMDNHLHLLLRVDPDIARDWSDQEVAKRWLTLYPPRDVKRQPIAPTQDMIQNLAENTSWVQTARERLSSLSWFMKCLKEPLSRMANKQDNCKGTFFEARFKSIAILDEESLLTVAAYIDLNPVAAGVASLPEPSPHTSIKERVDHVVATGNLENVEAIRSGSVSAQQVSEGIEDNCWLIPIEDQRSQGGKREGLIEGFTLGQYLMLVDCTSRTVRDNKQSVSTELESIFDR